MILLKKRNISFVLILLCQLVVLNCFAQTKDKDNTIVITDTTDLDLLFKKARDLSYAKNNTQARAICIKILEKRPNYYDVRTFLGLTYAWDHQFDDARTELSRVLIEKEDDIDALAGLIDVETWDGHPEVANDYLKIALGHYPTSENFLLQKAKLQLNQEETENASITLRKILDLNPGNKNALTMLNGLTSAKLSNRFQLQYYTNYFQQYLQPQTLVAAELGRSFNFGSLAFRASYADKFDITGFQYEIDNYTRFSKSNYIFLNLGVSSSDIFPDLRGAAEIFQKISKGFEFSGGVRYLSFNPDETFIYTASLANYYRNYWFAFRAYITPKSNTGSEDFFAKSSQTYILSMRNYFGDADNFIGFRIGSGQSPDERKIPSIVTSRLNSYQGAFEYQLRAFGLWLVKAELAYVHEEIRQDASQEWLSVGITAKSIF